MAARSATIGNAIITWLNDSTPRAWPLTGWTAARDYDAEKKYEDLDDALTVEMAINGLQAIGYTREMTTRGTKVALWEYVIGVRQRYDSLGDLDRDWMDARQELLEDMALKLSELELTGQSSGYTVNCLEIDVAVNDWQHAKDNRVFHGELTLTMRETRPRT